MIPLKTKSRTARSPFGSEPVTYARSRKNSPPSHTKNSQLTPALQRPCPPESS